MTDAIKFKIPLDSPLDINAGDMFVNAAQPLFTYNRQKYQGSVLQTSVRYEDFGWFAGWWDHNFPILVVGDNDVLALDKDANGNDINIGNPLYDRFIARYLANGVPLFTFRNIENYIVYNITNTITPIAGSGTADMNRGPDTQATNTSSNDGGQPSKGNVTVTGQLQVSNAAVSVTFDPYPNGLYSWSVAGGNSGYYCRFSVADYIYRIEIGPVTTIGNDWFELRLGSAATLNGVTLPYTYSGGFHRWGLYNNRGIFELNITDNPNSSTVNARYVASDLYYSVADGESSQFTQAQTKSQRAGNYHYWILVDKTELTVKLTFTYQLVWQRVVPIIAQPQIEILGGEVRELPNMLQSYIVKSVPETINSTNDTYYKFAMPIWLSTKATTNMVIEPSTRLGNLNSIPNVLIGNYLIFWIQLQFLSGYNLGNLSLNWFIDNTKITVQSPLSGLPIPSHYPNINTAFPTSGGVAYYPYPAVFFSVVSMNSVWGNNTTGSGYTSTDSFIQAPALGSDIDFQPILTAMGINTNNYSKGIFLCLEFGGSANNETQSDGYLKHNHATGWSGVQPGEITLANGKYSQLGSGPRYITANITFPDHFPNQSGTGLLTTGVFNERQNVIYKDFINLVPQWNQFFQSNKPEPSIVQPPGVSNNTSWTGQGVSSVIMRASSVPINRADFVILPTVSTSANIIGWEAPSYTSGNATITGRKSNFEVMAVPRYSSSSGLSPNISQITSAAIAPPEDVSKQGQMYMGLYNPIYFNVHNIHIANTVTAAKQLIRFEYSFVIFHTVRVANQASATYARYWGQYTTTGGIDEVGTIADKNATLGNWYLSSSSVQSLTGMYNFIQDNVQFLTYGNGWGNTMDVLAGPTMCPLYVEFRLRCRYIGTNVGPPLGALPDNDPRRIMYTLKFATTKLDPTATNFNVRDSWNYGYINDPQRVFKIYNFDEETGDAVNESNWLDLLPYREFIPGPGYNNFQVLNNVPMFDPKLFFMDGDTGQLTFIVPICCYAYSIGKVSIGSQGSGSNTTYDITKSNLQAFSLKLISNREYAQLISDSRDSINDTPAMYRFDNNAGDKAQYATYNILELTGLKLLSVTQGAQENTIKLTVSYFSTSRVPFFSLIESSELIDNTTQAINYKNDIYPAWCVTGLIYSYSQTVRPVIASFDNGTSVMITYLLETGNFITAINYDKSYTITPYNTGTWDAFTLTDNISPSMITAPESGKAANYQVEQVITITGYWNSTNQGTFTLKHVPVEEEKSTLVNNTFANANPANNNILGTYTWLPVDSTRANPVLEGKDYYDGIDLSATIYFRQGTSNTFSARCDRTFIIDTSGLLTSGTTAGVDMHWPVSGFSIDSQSSSTVVFSTGYGQFNLTTNKLDFVSNQQSKVVYLDTVLGNASDEDAVLTGLTRVYVTVNNHFIVEVTPEGILNSNNLYLTYYSGIGDGDHPDWRNISFQYRSLYPKNDNWYRYILQADSTFFIRLTYELCDVRTNELSQVYARDLDDIRLFVKQFWSSSVSTENYWIIDPSHVLELTSSDLILWVKTDKLHDWFGDIWEIETFVHTSEVYDDEKGELVIIEETRQKKKARDRYFGTFDLYYSVSSAYNGSKGLLYKLQTNENGDLIVAYGDVTDTASMWDTEIPIFIDVTIHVKQVTFNSAGKSNDYVSGTMYTLQTINTDNLVQSSKISATNIDKHLLIGIANNRGLQQWTLDIYSNKLIKIVWGYGHVGINGSLTGGQIPNKANIISGTGSYGFSGSLYNIESLSTETESSARCITNGNNVWFLWNNIPEIISHLTWNGSGHETNILILNNNVVEDYKSTSFISSALFDLEPQAIGISTLFEGSISQTMERIIEIALPSLYIMDMKYSMLGHISHSVGQYAYVYYNSTRDMVDEKVESDITFVFKTNTAHNIELSSATTFINQLWLQIMLKAVNVLDNAAGNLRINSAKNEMSFDTKKFGEFASSNIAGAIGSAIQSTGWSISLKSKLESKYNLGMFFSISNKTQCWAGPGFVNHNFIGQCLAQSVTDNKTEGKRLGYFLALKGLSLALVDARIYIFRAIQNGLYHIIEGVGGATAGAATVVTPVGMAISLALSVVASALDALIRINEVGKQVLEGLADAVGSSTGGASFNGGLEKYETKLEYPHMYGNKPMSFFWPAFGIRTPVTYTDEFVRTDLAKDTQAIDLGGRNPTPRYSRRKTNWNDSANEDVSNGKFNGTLTSVYIQCLGQQTSNVQAPEDMAVVEGCTSFLSTKGFKDESVGVSPPVFPPPPIHDYILDRKWQLGVAAGAGEVIHVTCDDTKIIDGPFSNIYIDNTNSENEVCMVACPYTVIDVKKNVYNIEKYLRPVAVTPSTIALNINRVNVVHEGKAYHAFDGQTSRLVNWKGTAGKDKAMLYQHYLFQVNDHFKRSSIFPPNQFFGAFMGPPSTAIRSYERVANIVQALGKQEGLDNNIPGEQKDLQRYSIPVHSEQLNTLPAMVRMLAPYKLHVVEGVTSLTTDIRTTQSAYKAPSASDFYINGTMYRATEEYISEIVQQSGINAVSDVCASAGLQFLGATTREAFFYSPATKMYYSFTGNREITKHDVLNRFKSIVEGRWDFVNQEVVFKALCKDETLVIRMDNGQAMGEVFPAIETIYNNRSGYKIWSMAGGLVFQGPNRFILNRYVILDSMIRNIDNMQFGYIETNNRFPMSYQHDPGGKRWKRLSRDEYSQYRDYGWRYEEFSLDPNNSSNPDDYHRIWGWTHNPYGIVTAELGVDPEVDAVYEWEVTFEWTDIMEQMYKHNEFITVCIQATTITQGGSLTSAPTHLYLTKELFNRVGNVGYYTFQFQSRNGAGNRERLYIWSDAVIAITDLQLNAKNITVRRTQPLTIQQDVQDLIEF